MTWLRLPWTIVCALAHLVVGLFLVGIVFRFVKPRSRSLIVRWWSRRLLALCRVDVRVATTRAGLVADALEVDGPGALLVLNHVSWLDIFIVHAERPAHFIAKAEIARWPLVGYLTDRTGAVFIERGRRHAVREANHRVATMLIDGELVGMFPEGTTSDGTRLLPFHANLIQPAIDAGAPVVVAGVRYRDRRGDQSAATLYTGDIGLIESMMRIVRLGPIFAELTLIGAIDTAGITRHEVARRARIMIADALGFDDDPSEARAGLSRVLVPDGITPGPTTQGRPRGTALHPRDRSP